MSRNIEVTQFPGGIGTAGDANILSGVALPLPTTQALAVEDFLGGVDYATGWVTENIAGVVTPGILASSSGILRQASDGTPGTGASLVASSDGNLDDNFLVQAGTPAWIAARLAISDPVVDAWLLGFVPVTSGIAPPDGLYLFSAAASGDVNLIIENNAAAQESVLVATLTAADNGFLNVGIFWDGEKASAQVGDLGGNSLIPAVANIPAVGLCATAAFVEGAGGATNFDLDSIGFGGGR